MQICQCTKVGLDTFPWVDTMLHTQPLQVFDGKCKVFTLTIIYQTCLGQGGGHFFDDGSQAKKVAQ